VLIAVLLSVIGAALATAQTRYSLPTAVTDGEYVAAVFATGEFVCVNVKRERSGPKTTRRSEEPVQHDQKDDPRLLAYDLASRKPAWQAKRGAISWSSPILVDNDGQNLKGSKSWRTLL